MGDVDFYADKYQNVILYRKNKHMFAKIQALFSEPEAESTVSDEYKLQLASAVLLIEIAKADFVNDPDEEASIRASLQKHFSLSDAEVDSLFTDAKATGEDVISLHSFIRTINECCDDEEKAFLMQQMWRVAYADGTLDKYEDYNIRKIADLLYVSHQTFIQTKQAVLAELKD